MRKLIKEKKIRLTEMIVEKSKINHNTDYMKSFKSKINKKKVGK